MRYFAICPVRSGAMRDFVENKVAFLERQGDEVYLPFRDTEQSDETGYRICSDNLHAVREADAVLVFWDGKSQGCLFDLGMAFALGKAVVIAALPDKSEGKSFQNMITEWAGR